MQLRVGLKLDYARAHVVVGDMRLVSHVGGGSHPLLRLGVAARSLIRVQTEEVIHLLFLGVRYSSLNSIRQSNPRPLCCSIDPLKASLSLHRSSVDSSHLHLAFLHASDDLFLMHAHVHHGSVLLHSHCVVLLSILLGRVGG